MQEPTHAKEKLFLDTLAKIQKDRGSSASTMVLPMLRDMEQRKGSAENSPRKSSSTPAFKIYLCSQFQDFMCLKQIYYCVCYSSKTKEAEFENSVL